MSITLDHEKLWVYQVSIDFIVWLQKKMYQIESTSHLRIMDLSTSKIKSKKKNINSFATNYK